MTQNNYVKEAFGTYRDEDFYQAEVVSRDGTALIFVIEQLASKVQKDCFLSADGTFGIVPRGFKQLLIIMAELEGKVSLPLLKFID